MKAYASTKIGPIFNYRLKRMKRKERRDDEEKGKKKTEKVGQIKIQSLLEMREKLFTIICQSR
jgi:hypothetical protein